MPQLLPQSTQDLLGGDGEPLRIHEIESWIDALPLANVNETCQRIFSVLLILNGSGILGQDRFEALELLRKPVQYLSDTLKHHIFGATLPLTHKAHLYASHVYELNLKMANGYQRIYDELLDEDNYRQDFIMLAAGLHRSLFYLGQGLLIRYQVYAPCDPDYWRRIHRTFMETERKGLQSSVVKDPYSRNKRGTTIEEQYKQILLLALADPYRYSQADMAWIYSLMEQLTPQCKIYPAEYLGKMHNAGFVDVASDEAPCFIAYSNAPISTSCRLLDITMLIDTLRKSTSQKSGGTRNHALTGNSAKSSKHEWEMMQSLVRSWGSSAKRKYNRMQPKARRVELHLGLSAIHRLVYSSDSMPPKDTVDDINQPPQNKIRKNMFNGRTSSFDDSGTYLCEVINESPDGSHLKWRNAQQGKIRVGELIAINYTDSFWELPGIAAIRWVKTTNVRTIEVGIQLLSPDAIPVTIRQYIDGESHAEHDYLRGLYIPEFKATGQTASLILPAFLFHTDDVVSLIMDDVEHRLQLKNSVESTQGFSRFLFAALGTAQDQN